MGESPYFLPVLAICIQIRILEKLIPTIRQYSIFDNLVDFHYSYIPISKLREALGTNDCAELAAANFLHSNHPA